MEESEEELKSLLMKVKEKSENAGLKLNSRDFPCGPVAKTPGSQCKGPGLNPWLGN